MSSLVNFIKIWDSRGRKSAFLALVLIGLVHSLTIRISPTIWQDEVQIVDLGRSTLWPSEKGWSLSWTPRQRPITFVNYLGPTIQEIAYHLTAPSPVGPRASAIAGALLAAVLAYAWLRLRSVPGSLAWFLSVLLLIDPLFVAGYRGARVDSWVFVTIFGACVLLRRGAEAGGRSSLSDAKYFVSAGALAVVGFFVWPSAFYLYPLLIIDFIDLAPSWDRRTLGRRLWLAIGGGIVAAVICVLPLWSQIGNVWADIFTSKDAYVADGTLGRRLLSNLADVPATFKVSPILPLIAFAAAFFRRTVWLVAGTIVVMTLMLLTQIYTHRVVYLLPYMIGLVGEGCVVLRTRNSKVTSTRAQWTILGTAMAWSIGLSLIVRPVLALSQRTQRNPDRLVEAATQVLGRGEKKVFLTPWEFYYAGRALGWRMFKPYGKFSDAEIQALLGNLDAAIVGRQEPAEFIRLLTSAGFGRTLEFRVGSENVRTPATMGASLFGVYVLYSRTSRK